MAKKKLNFECISDIKPDNDVDSKALIQKSMISLGISSNIVKIDPKKIDNWIYRDRSEFELGDIDSLAESIKLKGQAQPIIITSTQNSCFKPQNNSSAKYVVIAGYRRWLACQKHNIGIEAVIKDIGFDDAIALLDAENEKESVSEYSKGMFYSSLINSGSITRDELRIRLSLKAASLSNLLSFNDVPKEIWDAIGDISKVSSRTASVLRSFINKDLSYINKIIGIADKIKAGAGEKVVTKLLTNQNSKTAILSEEIFIKDQKICEFKNREIIFNKSIGENDIKNIQQQIKDLLNRYYER